MKNGAANVRYVPEVAEGQLSCILINAVLPAWL